MTTQIIPLVATPAQTLTVTLGGQACRIILTTRLTGLFMDLYVKDAPVVQGVICLNWTKIVREVYRGFVGDLVFRDTQGTEDPTYDGLGGRFELLYVS